MTDKINKLAAARVLVFGDVMLDSYLEGSADRISPEAPVPVVRIMHRDARLGGAGNVALNTAKLGARTTLLGFLGDDLAGDQIEALVSAAGIAGHFYRVPDSRSIQKLRVLSRHQQLIRLDFDDGFHDVDGLVVFESFGRALSDIDILILSDYAKGSLRNAQVYIEMALKAGKRVIVDPKGNRFDVYRGASLVTPNLSEFEAVVGPCKGEDDIERKGYDLVESLDLGGLLVTRSEKGMTLLERGRLPVHLPTHAQEVFDVTGAGDTVVAILGAAWAAGFSLEEAVKLSNIGAGLVVAKVGTASITPEELSEALRALESPG